MAVQSIQQQQAFMEFIRLAQSVKNKNPILGAAGAQTMRSTPIAASTVGQAPATASTTALSAGYTFRAQRYSTDAPSQPIRYTKVLGNNFDTYA